MDTIDLNNNYDTDDFNNIKNEFINRMKQYNIDFQKKDEEGIDIMINALLNTDIDRDRYTYVINSPCGTGKSTLLDVYINYMYKKHNGNYGCIVAKERVEDIVKYAEENPETHYPLYGFKPEDCLVGRKTYNPNACRICKEEECRVKQNKYEVENYPVLVTTHSRIQLAESLWFLQEQLINYMYEVKPNKLEPARRYDLFIDENPTFYELNRIKISDIDILNDELNNTYRRECKNKNELIKYFKEKIKETKNRINESHIYFDGIIDSKTKMREFRKYEDMFNGNYYGDEFIKCLNVISVIKYGGKIIDSDIVFPLYRSLQSLPFNKIIFDATSSINMNYPEHTCKLVEVPETRNFDNVTINWCDNNNLSKRYYEEHTDMANRIVNYISDNTEDHNEILLVTFKDKKEEYRDLLELKCMDDKVILMHCNATKGRNDMSNTTCIVIAYNLYKGDDFYLFGQHYKVDHVDPENVVFNSQNKKRTAYIITDKIDENGNKTMQLSKEIDEFIVMDKAVDLIQEVFRTAVRKYNQREKIDIYLFNTDNRVIEILNSFLPGSNIIEWKPFDVRKKSKQYDEYINAIMNEFKDRESGYDISTAKFKNRYNIKNRTFAEYQKDGILNDYLKDTYGVIRKGNFLVKI